MSNWSYVAGERGNTEIEGFVVKVSDNGIFGAFKNDYDSYPIYEAANLGALRGLVKRNVTAMLPEPVKAHTVDDMDEGHVSTIEIYGFKEPDEFICFADFAKTKHPAARTLHRNLRKFDPKRKKRVEEIEKEIDALRKKSDKLINSWPELNIDSLRDKAKDHTEKKRKAKEKKK